ncbi:MAG TPA: hypothetical protein PKD76_06325 [Solirubrobacterales bacterium]|nr:hypothetical protein [Solirubrobacterales bacterium]
MIYKLIGMAVVKLGWMFLRRKAAANRGLVAGFTAVVVIALLTVIAGTAGYALTRETPEA